MPQLGEFDKIRIISFLEERWSIRQIARRFGVNKNTVSKLITRWRTVGTVGRNPGSGRPRISTPAEDIQLVTAIRENPFSNVVAESQNTNFPGSSRTGRRRIRESNLECHVASNKFGLLPRHKEARVGFALEHYGEDPEFWTRVIFSDEKIFQSSHSGKIIVYRPRNTTYNPDYVNQGNLNGKFSVNFWGWISAHGPGVLWQLQDNLNADQYVSILNNVMLPSVLHLYPENNFTFQQDNCPVHTARICTHWFEENNVTVLPWASRSPDLNPIENVWGLITKTLNQRRVRPENDAELAEFVNGVRDELTVEYCDELCRSMPIRLDAVIGVNGAMTKY